MTRKIHSQVNFPVWKAKLDELCKNFYCINSEDMCWDDESLNHHREHDTTPEEMCEYLGEKYQLTHKFEFLREFRFGT